MKIKIVKLLLILVLVIPSLFAQGNFTSVNNNVYQFLERMAISHNLDYSGIIKPLTRLQITEALKKLNHQRAILSSVEKDELGWYLKEYDYELQYNSKKLKNQTSKDQHHLLSSSNYSYKIFSLTPRLHFFTYTDDNFHLVADPILGISVKNSYNEIQYHRWNGIVVYGNYGSKWGFNFSFRDNWEKGNKADRSKRFSNATGIVIASAKDNQFEYSEVNASITYETDKLILTLGKDFLEIGSGFRGKIIQSTKAPSFPFVRLDFFPTNWLSFNYFHGWLSSLVIDSARSFSTLIQDQHRIKYREKYIANHSITLKPINGLYLTVGESIIYGENLNILYLIPINFYRLADHYESQGNNNAGSNSQFFFDVNARLIKNLQLYSTLFIDEISISKLLKGQTDRNQFGFSVGAYNYGSIRNFGLRLEYTRILPWVYSHYIPNQTYYSSNYTLGHYIGQNADQIFTQIDFRLKRGLVFKLWGEYIRYGGLSDIKNQYELPGEDFLYGLKRFETNFGFEINFEILHDLFVKAFYQYSKISDEDNTRTPDWQIGKHNSFGFNLFFGL